MRCPQCSYSDSKVTDSRSVEMGIRRRRECLECGARFTTYERVDNSTMSIVKKDQRREAFDREKLLNGLRRACQKRPLPTGTVEKLIDDIEYEIQRTGRTEVPSSKIGEMVMERLLTLDQIAYVRFASVYRSFADISSLKKVVDDLVEEPEKGSQLPLMSGDELNNNGE
ncbi:MAG: transcriptional repressor NrdR [Chloroflexi bacterium]|jgi:transcriptional repressor NrdR|nr:transcriptional repressor NrdR [Chloroflexota bacterium]